MKNVKSITTALFLMAFTLFNSLKAQNNEKLKPFIGFWMTEDKAVIQVLEQDKMIVGKLFSAVKEKDKKDNGKVILKKLSFVKESDFKGIFVDPESMKEYEGKIVLTNDNKTMEVKIKWGLLSFNEKWIKIK